MPELNKTLSKMNFQTIKEMAFVSCIACIIVLFAMAIDLASGLYKAKQRKEIRSSWGLKRTVSKFIMYEGGMMIAFGVDLLIYFSRIFELFHLTPIVGIPVVTCLIGIFLLVVEFMSIREKSDKKTKKDFSEAGEALAKLIESKTFKDAIVMAMNANKENEHHGHHHHHDDFYEEEEIVHEPSIEE